MSPDKLPLMLAPLLVALAMAIGPGRFDFFSHGPYDSAVPKPDVLLGYGAGEHETDYMNQDRVVQAIVDSSPAKSKYITYGKSVEGRPLRIVVISSAENMARLDAIRADIGSLASGDAKDPSGVIGRTVPIVWVNECIHGNEPASFESGMWLIYTLTASQEPAIRDAMSKAVVIVNPSYNPDGHERFVDWYNSVATGSTDRNAFELAEPSVVSGRLNHYRFDMNRDRVAMSQPETRQEVAEFQQWHPQVYVDQHGQVQNYFFPPTSMSVNANVDRARYNKWTDIFGRATASAFDANGFSYYVKDVFDLYYPGYLDSWSTLNGAIGMTHETDGPKSLAVMNSDGSVATLREGISKHFTSAIAVIESAAAHGPELLKSFSDYKHDQVSGKMAGKDRFVVARGDRESLDALQAQLASEQILSVVSASEIKVKDARSFWSKANEMIDIPAGHALIIPMAQPQGALAKALLEDKSDFEPEFVAEQMRRRQAAMSDEKYPQADPAEFYDMTAWGLVYSHNLDGWWVQSLPSNAMTPAPTADAPDWSNVLNDSTSVGFAIPPSEDASILAFHLLTDGVRLQSTSREMKVQARTFPGGTFLVFKAANRTSDDQDMIATSLAKWAKNYRGDLVALKTSYPDEGRQGPGSESVSSVRKPSVAVVFGDSSSTSDFGSTWFLLERQLGLPFTPLRKGALSGDLSKYSCILFPEGRYDAPSEALKTWIQNGGCAVILGGGSWAIGDKSLIKLDQVRVGKDKMPGGLPGSIFKAELDPRSFLSFGYPHNGDARIPVAVPLSGDQFYKVKSEGGSVVSLSADEKVNKLLSGWEWPNDTEKNLQGVVWLQDQPMGSGHVILFSEDPTQRAMWPGLNRMVLNAILLGPSS
jgi:hypothetical protein